MSTKKVKANVVQDEHGYRRKFLALLKAEEEQIDADIRTYDLFEANRRPGKGLLCDQAGTGLVIRKSAPGWILLSLEVAGLLEKRPNVVYGDHMRFRFTAPTGQLMLWEFVGYVHRRRGTCLTVCLAESVLDFLTRPAIQHMKGFKCEKNTTGGGKCYAGPSGKVSLRSKRWQEPLYCHIRFVFNHAGLYRMRRVLMDESLRRVLRLLLPSPELPPAGASDDASRHAQDPSRCNDKALNAEQRLAVERMIAPVHPRSADSSADRPLVIFGPPGTGKTKTVVEGVLRAVMHGGPAARVLCCAPSNAAADVIVQRLVAQARLIPARDGAFTPWCSSNQGGRDAGTAATKWLLRVNHFSHSVDSVRPDVLQWTYMDDQEDLLAVSVVVTTCGGASILGNCGVSTEHFNLIVVDEAAQALEPETLIPLMLKGAQCRAVLTGDWQQLGPVVRSSEADKSGLSMSLMERLVSNPYYKSPSCPCLVRLTRNYRSHEQLLEVPSKLFYQDQLLACGDRTETDSLLGASAELLADDHEPAGAEDDGEVDSDPPLVDFPLLFYGVEGRDVREDDSPSFYNPTEALVVCSLVKKLLASSCFDVTPQCIGVIAPYRKQVQKIRLLLRKDGLDDVRVGTVDDYQGQEERVVFISTTLSHTERLNVDSEYSLGFLGNPRRFNVALTRAKGLCVVVGNPYVMLVKEHWKALLQFCINNRSYAGCPPPLHARDESGEEEDWLEDEEALMQLIQERMLGGGAVSRDVGSELDRMYRDEQEFRVIL